MKKTPPSDMTDMPYEKPGKGTYVGLVIIVSIIILIIGFSTGVIQLAFNTIGCMRVPVATTDLMGGRDYSLPGHYPPNILNHYYCTEEDAVRAGYHH